MKQILLATAMILSASFALACGSNTPSNCAGLFCKSNVKYDTQNAPKPEGHGGQK